MAELENWMKGIIIFSMAVSCLVFFSDDIFEFYGTDNEDYRFVYDNITSNIDQESDRSDDIRENVEKTEINTGFTNYVSLITDSVVTAIKTPFLSLWAVIRTISIVADKIGIPAFITKGIFAILIVTISFMVLNWIFIRRVR